MKTKMHNGSRLLSLLLAVVLVFTLTVPALAAEKPQDMNLRIAFMSDLHYLSPDMIADTEDFEHAFNSDRKLLKESSSVLHEMLERVRADKPDHPSRVRRPDQGRPSRSATRRWQSSCSSCSRMFRV